MGCRLLLAEGACWGSSPKHRLLSASPPAAAAAVAHGRYLLVATASTAWQAPDGAAGVAALVPRVDATTFHLVSAGKGCCLGCAYIPTVQF